MCWRVNETRMARGSELAGELPFDARGRCADAFPSVHAGWPAAEADIGRWLLGLDWFINSEQWSAVPVMTTDAVRPESRRCRL